MIFLFNGTPTIAQTAYLNGFQQALGGTHFTYHSPYSFNDKSLLVRANKDFAAIEWETSSIPADYAQASVSFIWLYGVDVLPQSQSFELFVNDQYLLTFSNPTNNQEQGEWEVPGAKGSKLSFNRSMIDKHGDQMGYAVLTLPVDMVGRRKAATIKIDGADNFSSAWFMTFKIPLENRFSSQQLSTVTRKDGSLYHTVRFNYIHLAPPTPAMIVAKDIEQKILLKTGLNEIDLLLPKIEIPQEISTSIQIDGKRAWQQSIVVAPVKEWTIHLVQHSHTDIGYTRPQSEILAEHLRYIDDALDYCDQTDHLPKEAQFRWTCEAAWTVREYLNSRPQPQIDRLLARIQEGRIEVTGMFFNFSEIIDETALAIQMQTLNQFKEQGIDVSTAMQNDVNGIGWCMVDLYHDTGVKFLTMGQHGHRARIPFSKPTAFWWESPSGKRMLAYRNEHYMHGNALSLTSGEIDVFRDNLSKYLLDLEEKDYPLNRISLQFSGYLTDNSPPSTKACAIVQAWNEKYEWPKLKLSLASEFMLFLEQNHSEQLDVKRVAWPDWWTDGFGTAMRETQTARNTHTDMIANLGLLAMAKTQGAKIPESIHREVSLCYDNLLFYDEHTFGADESISNPYSENSINQWRQKSAYVWSAHQQSTLLREKAIGLIRPYLQPATEPTITVFNTLNWKRSGVVEVFIDHDKLPLDKAFKIIDPNGKAIPAQIMKSKNDGSWWSLWVEDIPPLGYASYTIIVSESPLKVVDPNKAKSQILENKFYRITIDEAQNGLSSIFDKTLNRELIDQGNPYKLGAFIYEQLDNRSDLERLTNLNRDTVYRPLKKQITQLSDFHITKVEEHPIWTSVFFNGKLPVCANAQGVHMELRLYHQTKQIELLYRMVKQEITDPEGVYIAFPFHNQDQGKLLFEAQGGVVQPGKNQLEGTASDWNTIQNFAAVRGQESQIVFCSNDVPLVQFGDINTGRYYYRNQPKNSHIYSWVLNNYWTTNFKASQYGELQWKYQITSSENPSLTFATKFGWGNRVPLVATVNAGSVEAASPAAKSILDLNATDNLLLVSARPDLRRNAVLLHLRETEGDHAIMEVSRLLEHPNITSVMLCNGLGEEIMPLTTPILIEHFETVFLLIILKD
ncbi:MAG: glycoside hydrolase family 38 C-terminal domain-containing protein [Bacteroidota bacterium]